jgi:hypothetical protein
MSGDEIKIHQGLNGFSVTFHRGLSSYLIIFSDFQKMIKFLNQARTDDYIDIDALRKSSGV